MIQETMMGNILGWEQTSKTSPGPKVISMSDHFMVGLQAGMMVITAPEVVLYLWFESYEVDPPKMCAILWTWYR